MVNNQNTCYIAIPSSENTHYIQRTGPAATDFRFQPATQDQINTYNTQQDNSILARDLSDAKIQAIQQVTDICNASKVIGIINDIDAITGEPINDPYTFILKNDAIEPLLFSQLGYAHSNQKTGSLINSDPYEFQWTVDSDSAINSIDIGTLLLDIIFPFPNTTPTLHPGQVAMNAVTLYQIVHGQIGIINNAAQILLSSMISNINAITNQNDLTTLMISNWQSSLVTVNISKATLCQICAINSSS